MTSVNVALFQIVQYYDADWPHDLISCGYHAEADALSDVMGGREIPDGMALRLRDIMAGAVMQRDSADHCKTRL